MAFPLHQSEDLNELYHEADCDIFHLIDTKNTDEMRMPLLVSTLVTYYHFMRKTRLNCSAETVHYRIQTDMKTSPENFYGEILGKRPVHTQFLLEKISSHRSLFVAKIGNAEV